MRAAAQSEDVHGVADSAIGFQMREKCASECEKSASECKTSASDCSQKPFPSENSDGRQSSELLLPFTLSAYRGSENVWAAVTGAHY
jgi:hypothetical protein